MIITGAVFVLAVGLHAASLDGKGGDSGRVSRETSNRGAWQDDTIVFQDERPWDGSSYAFGFKTLFGNTRQEKAELKENSLGNKYLDVEGEFSYPMAGGFVRRVKYRADDKGYRQSGPIITNIMNNLKDSEAILADRRSGLAYRQMLQTDLGRTKSLDKIHFPTEENEVILTTTPNSIALAGATEKNNDNSTDYYDELGNRVGAGGIPPSVLGSLLG